MDMFRCSGSLIVIILSLIEPVLVVFWLTISWNCLQSILVPPAFAGLVTYSRQMEVLSVARTGQEKLTPISVAVTDQIIGLLVSALCEVRVTMDRLGNVHHKPYERSVDHLPGCPFSPRVTGNGLPQTLRQILLLILSGCLVSPFTSSNRWGCRLSRRLPDPWDG